MFILPGVIRTLQGGTFVLSLTVICLVIVGMLYAAYRLHTWYKNRGPRQELAEARSRAQQQLNELYTASRSVVGATHADPVRQRMEKALAMLGDTDRAAVMPPPAYATLLDADRRFGELMKSRTVCDGVVTVDVGVMPAGTVGIAHYRSVADATARLIPQVKLARTAAADVALVCEPIEYAIATTPLRYVQLLQRYKAVVSAVEALTGERIDITRLRTERGAVATTLAKASMALEKCNFMTAARNLDTAERALNELEDESQA